jgi:hypothetical protein
MFFNQQEGSKPLQPQKQQQPQGLAEEDSARRNKQFHEQQQQTPRGCQVRADLNQAQQQQQQHCL